MIEIVSGLKIMSALCDFEDYHSGITKKAYQNNE